MPRERMSLAAFNALPIVAGFCVLPDRPCRSLIERNGRRCWHVVSLESLFGRTFYTASEVVIVAAAAEAA